MKLIENWREVWKFASTWVAGAALALAGAEQFLPELQGKVPPAVYGFLATLFVVARVAKQSGLVKEPPADEQ